VKKVVRTMTPICSAPMHTEPDARYRILDTRSPRDSLRRTKDENRASRIENRVRGFTLTELVVVLLIVSLFVLLAQANLFIVEKQYIQSADARACLDDANGCQRRSTEQ
jgi:prepilin-type N-terminal cleavage/methylation domain-containing protein